LARIAVTGTASFLGGRILRRLVDARGADAVVAVDIAAPPATLHGVRHRMVDLTLPGADRRLVEIFEEEGIDTVVHAAFFTDPRRDASYSHELESIGTLHLAAAAAAGGVRHLVVRSFTAVYGARGQNPGFLTEESHPSPPGRLPWVQDKLEAEDHAFSFAKRYPRLGVSVLRFATLLGPGVHTFYTRIFSKRVVPVVLGYDPLIQLLHPEDALDAVDAVLVHGPSGILNIVPSDSMTFLTALHLSDKLTVPVPHPLAYPLADFWWGAGVGEAPGGFVDCARFQFVADGEKARRELGFVPRHSSHDALAAFLAYRYPEPLRERSMSDVPGVFRSVVGKRQKQRARVVHDTSAPSVEADGKGTGAAARASEEAEA
jgi:UDP-glucose 4-epimerase